MRTPDAVDMKSKRGCKFGIRNSDFEIRKAALLRTRLSRVKRGRGKADGGREKGDRGRGLLGTPKDGWLTPV